jgi:two-component system chemotaxis response regulator CheY
MPRTVLLVDDSPMARRMLARALPEGWASEVRHAGDGFQAMAALRAERPDVMFLDLNMPEMDGYEVLDAVRREGIDVPIIVLSADVQPRAQEKALALGARGLVEKPVQPRAIADALRRAGVL